MNNGFLLIITFSIPLVLLMLFFFLIKKRKKRHLYSLDVDLNNFNKAIEHKDINGINKYGTELIWNENLTDTILKNMSEDIDELISTHSELKHLKNLIYNKRLHWNKTQGDGDGF